MRTGKSSDGVENCGRAQALERKKKLSAHPRFSSQNAQDELVCSENHEKLGVQIFGKLFADSTSDRTIGRVYAKKKGPWLSNGHPPRTPLDPKYRERVTEKVKLLGNGKSRDETCIKIKKSKLGPRMLLMQSWQTLWPECTNMFSTSSVLFLTTRKSSPLIRFLRA
jgi:hypothetical protein